MSQNYEKLSALIDEELNDSEQKNVKKLFENEEDVQFYLRQQMVNQVLKGEQIAKLPADFNKKITDNIADEPAIFAPNNIPANNMPDNKQKMPETRQKVIGFAIAASVAMVSFVMLQSNQTQTSVPQFKPAQVAQVIGFDGVRPASSANKASSGYQLASESKIISPEQWHGLQQHDHKQYKMMMNQYLATHTEVSSVGQIQGIMPYSKIVGYDTQK